MVVGLGRIRHALGDGVTEDQARRVHTLLRDAGLLEVQPAAPALPLVPIEGLGVLVGVAEIADLAGVSASHVCNWRHMPEPLVTLKAGPVWRLTDVQERIDACVLRRRKREAVAS